MHPFVASQIAITFQHEVDKRTAAKLRDLERRGPAPRTRLGRRLRGTR